MSSGAAPATPPPRRPSLLASAVATLGTRAIDIPARYGFHLLVAGKLGVVPAGGFYIVFGILTLAAGLGRLGVDRAMTRDIAAALARNDPARARRTIGKGLALMAVFSGLAAAGTALAAPFLAARVFGNPDLALSIMLAGATLVPLCLSAGVAGVLAGLHRVGQSQMLYSWLWPALFCAIALWIELDLERAFRLLLAATTLAAVVSALLLWRAFPPRGESTGQGEPYPVLMPLGWALFTTEIVQLLVAALPALVLGMVATQADVGAFAMAWRLALVLNLLVVALAAMASPRFADAAARGDERALATTAAQTLGLTLLLGFGPLIVLLVAAPWLLGLFGAGFSEGAAAMRILLAGQFVLMLAAATPELLGMAGYEKPMQRVNQLAVIVYVPLLAGLGWLAGDIGAAIATLAVSLVTAIGSSLQCRRNLGFVPLQLLPGMVREVRRVRG